MFNQEAEDRMDRYLAGVYDVPKEATNEVKR